MLLLGGIGLFQGSDAAQDFTARAVLNHFERDVFSALSPQPVCAGQRFAGIVSWRFRRVLC